MIADFSLQLQAQVQGDARLPQSAQVDGRFHHVGQLNRRHRSTEANDAGIRRQSLRPADVAIQADRLRACLDGGGLGRSVAKAPLCNAAAQRIEQALLRDPLGTIGGNRGLIKLMNRHPSLYGDKLRDFIGGDRQRNLFADEQS